jgi:hypothetical protein
MAVVESSAAARAVASRAVFGALALGLLPASALDEDEDLYCSSIAALASVDPSDGTEDASEMRVYALAYSLLRGSVLGNEEGGDLCDALLHTYVPRYPTDDEFSQKHDPEARYRAWNSAAEYARGLYAALTFHVDDYDNTLVHVAALTGRIDFLTEAARRLGRGVQCAHMIDRANDILDDRDVDRPLSVDGLEEVPATAAAPSPEERLARQLLDSAQEEVDDLRGVTSDALSFLHGQLLTAIARTGTVEDVAAVQNLGASSKLQLPMEEEESPKSPSSAQLDEDIPVGASAFDDWQTDPAPLLTEPRGILSTPATAEFTASPLGEVLDQVFRAFESENAIENARTETNRRRGKLRTMHQESDSEASSQDSDRAGVIDDDDSLGLEGPDEWWAGGTLGVNIRVFGTRSHVGATPVACAAVGGSALAIRLLVSLAPNVPAEELFGWDSIHFQQGDVRHVDAILPNNGLSAAHLAAVCGNPDALIALRSLGADVDLEHKESGVTPLSLACSGLGAHVLSDIRNGNPYAALILREEDEESVDEDDESTVYTDSEVDMQGLPSGKTEPWEIPRLPPPSVAREFEAEKEQALKESAILAAVSIENYDALKTFDRGCEIGIMQFLPWASPFTVEEKSQPSPLMIETAFDPRSLYCTRQDAATMLTAAWRPLPARVERVFQKRWTGDPEPAHDEPETALETLRAVQLSHSWREWGRTRCAAVLLRMGVRIGGVENAAATPLTWAAVSSSVAPAVVLLANGAHPGEDPLEIGSLAWISSQTGCSALLLQAARIATHDFTGRESIRGVVTSFVSSSLPLEFSEEDHHIILPDSIRTLPDVSTDELLPLAMVALCAHGNTPVPQLQKLPFPNDETQLVEQQHRHAVARRLSTALLVLSNFDQPEDAPTALLRLRNRQSGQSFSRILAEEFASVFPIKELSDACRVLATKFPRPDMDQGIDYDASTRWAVSNAAWGPMKPPAEPSSPSGAVTVGSFSVPLSVGMTFRPADVPEAKEEDPEQGAVVRPSKPSRSVAHCLQVLQRWTLCALQDAKDRLDSAQAICAQLCREDVGYAKVDEIMTLRESSKEPVSEDAPLGSAPAEIPGFREDVGAPEDRFWMWDEGAQHDESVMVLPSQAPLGKRGTWLLQAIRQAFSYVRGSDLRWAGQSAASVGNAPFLTLLSTCLSDVDTRLAGRDKAASSRLSEQATRRSVFSTEASLVAQAIENNAEFTAERFVSQRASLWRALLVESIVAGPPSKAEAPTAEADAANIVGRPTLVKLKNAAFPVDRCIGGPREREAGRKPAPWEEVRAHTDEDPRNGCEAGCASQ